jgi:hypothetical protein
MALAKPHVRERMQHLIQENLRAGSLRASSRMREIMEDSENSMAAYRASAYLLGTGAGVTMPSPPSNTVNIAIGGPAPGYVIDLAEPGASGERVVVRPSGPSSGPLIEGRAVELGDDGAT